MCQSQVSYIKIKAFWLFGEGGGGGSFKVIFVRISQNFIKSPLKVLWTFKNNFETLHGLNDSDEKTNMLKTPS